MINSLAILDIGDVLIGTRPMRQYRALAERSGLEWRQVATLLEESGVITEFELGEMRSTAFTRKVRHLVGGNGLSHNDVVEAWRSVIGSPVTEMIDAVRPLARERRLLLASNTNPIHWHYIRGLLAEAGIVAPRILSYEVGHAKPDPEFFAAVLRADERAGRISVFVDDRLENITAAAAQGLPGWVHRTPRESSDLLDALRTFG